MTRNNVFGMIKEKCYDVLDSRKMNVACIIKLGGISIDGEYTMGKLSL